MDKVKKLFLLNVFLSLLFFYFSENKSVAQTKFTATEFGSAGSLDLLDVSTTGTTFIMSHSNVDMTGIASDLNNNVTYEFGLSG